MLTLCLYSFLCIMHSTTSYEILGLFPFPAKSHFLAFDSLMQELSSRGHNVTIYNTFPKTLSIPNYHEVDISHCFKLPDRLDIKKLKSKSTWFLSFQDVYAFTYYLPSYTEISKCEPLIKLANVTGTTKKYDLVITEIFHNEFSLLFASKMNIPVIGIVAGDTFPWHWYTSGLPENPSYIPMIFGEPMWKTGFFRRVEDALVYLYSFYQYHSWRQMMENTAFKIFRSSVPFQDLAKNVSLLFLNRHFAYQTSRPIVPNVVEIGGLNIKSVAELPENIEKFINESQHGVVYFCMGSLLRGETFPEEKRNAFLYAFSKIPQRVLWKWEGEVLPGKSDNIMISKWMPQRDILAHPNVKLFISHGGLLGTSEAVYEGVPVLGIPIFGDQRTNIKSLEANGAGELLDYNEITKDVVLEKIQRLLNDPKYKENAKQLSARYRDRPMSPLDTAVYWTEYVIRHKGAPHLRTAAADMPWYQYLLLDVIAFLILVTVSALAILYYSIKLTLRFLCNLICGKKSSSKPATGKKVKRN